MTQHVVRPEVAAFVAQVRAALSDLSPDEVEELAGGLEADLDERLADTLPGAPAADLGHPATYAAELRAAAGLPPRGAGGGRRGAGPGLLTRAARAVEARLQAVWQPASAAVRRQPWWPEFRASVIALRPAWWLVRGWVAYRLCTSVIAGAGGLLPATLAGLVVLLAFIGVSVALGRGLLDAGLGLARRRWARRILFGLNVFAVLMLPVALAGAVGTNYVYVDDGAAGGGPGLAMDGQTVVNVYAFDAQGNPIPVVQLYDQNGRPLELHRNQDCCDGSGGLILRDGNGAAVTPYLDDRGQQRWNAYPVPHVSTPEPTYGPDGVPTATAPPAVRTPPPPLVAVPPIVGSFGAPQPVTTSPTASTTPSSAGSRSATPTGTTPATTAAVATPTP